MNERDNNRDRSRREDSGREEYGPKNRETELYDYGRPQVLPGRDYYGEQGAYGYGGSSGNFGGHGTAEGVSIGGGNTSEFYGGQGGQGQAYDNRVEPGPSHSGRGPKNSDERILEDHDENDASNLDAPEGAR